MTLRLMPVTAALAVAALVLTGCSGGTPAADAPAEGPLGRYLSALYDEDEWSEDKMKARDAAIEEAVAVCMTKEGFEYQPNVQSYGYVTEDDADGPQWGSEAFVKEYGYGYSQQPEMPDSGSEQEYVDPNQDYLDSLSESEQSAYYEALHGAGPADDEIGEDGSYEYDWETAGCYGAAQNEQNEGKDPWTDPEFADTMASIEELWNASMTDPKMGELDAEWTSCMATAGYPEYQSRQEPSDDVMERSNALWEDLSEAELEHGPSKAALAEVQEFEIAVATADFQCAKKIKYDKRSEKIRFDLEQAFVDEHSAELDAMLAKYQTKKKK